MRAFAIALIAVSALTPGAAAATDIEVVANSILQAYSDYCDPLYFDQHQATGAATDYDLSQSYGRVLFARYAGDCSHFLAGEVAGATAVPDMLNRVPYFATSRPKALTDLQVGILGMIQRYDDLTQNECGAQADTKDDLTPYLSVAKPWWLLLGRDEALTFAKGYVGAEQFARLATGIPEGGNAAMQCGLRHGVAGAIGLSLVNNGLFEPYAAPSSDDGYSTKDFEEWAATPPVASPEVDGDQETQDYVWEPGDPGTDRGNGDQPIDLTPYVDPADVAAIKPFAGVWGSTASCDEGHTYLIGQFDWKDGQPQLGRGVPRISTEHLACEAGQWSVTGDISTFSALCHPGGEGAWSGTGTIRWVSEDAVQLFLLDDSKPVRLERCSNQPFDVRDASSANDSQTPIDLFGD